MRAIAGVMAPWGPRGVELFETFIAVLRAFSVGPLGWETCNNGCTVTSVCTCGLEGGLGFYGGRIIGILRGSVRGGLRANIGRLGRNTLYLGFRDPNFANMPSEVVLLPNRGMVFIRAGGPNGGRQTERRCIRNLFETLKFRMCSAISGGTCIRSVLRHYGRMVVDYRKVYAAWLSAVLR